MCHSRFTRLLQTSQDNSTACVSKRREAILNSFNTKTYYKIPIRRVFCCHLKWLNHAMFMKDTRKPKLCELFCNQVGDSVGAVQEFRIWIRRKQTYTRGTAATTQVSEAVGAGTPSVYSAFTLCAFVALIVQVRLLLPP